MTPYYPGSPDWTVDPEEQRRRDEESYKLTGFLPNYGSESGLRNMMAPGPAENFSHTSQRDPRIQKALDAGYSMEEITAKLTKQAIAAPPTIDPTEGMSASDKFFAGAGGRMMELYRGGKQKLGSILPEGWIDQEAVQRDIDEQKRLDAPLKASGAGTIGGLATDLAGVSLGGAAGAGKLLPQAMRLSEMSAPARVAAVPTYGAAGGAAQSVVEPIASDETQLEKTLGSMAGGALGSTLGGVTKRLISPLPTASLDYKTQLANALESQGVKTSVGQATDLPWARKLEEFIPLGGRAGGVEQEKQFTKAVAKHIGLDTDALTPEAMEIAARDIGRTIERAGNAAPQPFSNTFLSKLGAIETQAKRDAADFSMASTPGEDATNRLLERVTSPNALPFDGSSYLGTRKTLTHEINRLQIPTNTEKDKGAALEVMIKLRDALDDEAERMWGRGQKGELDTAWKQWNVLKDLQKPGVLDPTTGRANPQALYATVDKQLQTGLSGRTGSDYSQLARAGTLLEDAGGNRGQIMLARALGLGVGGVAAYNDPDNIAGPGALLASALLYSRYGRNHAVNDLMRRYPGFGKTLMSGGASMGADLLSDYQ